MNTCSYVIKAEAPVGQVHKKYYLPSFLIYLKNTKKGHQYDVLFSTLEKSFFCSLEQFSDVHS